MLDGRLLSEIIAMRPHLLTLALCAFLLGPHTAGATETPMIRVMWAAELNADANGHFITDAMINGSPVKVLVDTGASMVALSYEDADKVRLWPRSLRFDIPVMTANGQINAARVTIPRVKVGNIEVRDVDGVVMPKGALEGTLLGMSFLNRLSSFKIENGVLFLRD